MVRGPVLALKEREFVEATRALGAGALLIVGRHIVPNLTSVLVVQTSIALSWALLTEASPSFLGLSAQPPAPSTRRRSATTVTACPYRGEALRFLPSDHRPAQRPWLKDLPRCGYNCGHNLDEEEGGRSCGLRVSPK